MESALVVFCDIRPGNGVRILYDAWKPPRGDVYSPELSVPDCECDGMRSLISNTGTGQDGIWDGKMPAEQSREDKIYDA